MSRIAPPLVPRRRPQPRASRPSRCSHGRTVSRAAAGRVTLPTVTVTAQKEPADPQELPVSVTAVPLDTLQERRHHHDRATRSIYAPNTYFTEFTARKLSNPRVPRHRLEPGQPGDHDLHRRRAAAQRQLVEHRAARRRADRVRARAAERAVRPQHARRAGQHHAARRPSLTKWTGSAVGAVRQLRRRATCAANASGPIGEKAGASASRSATRSATASRRTTSPATTSTRATATFGKAQLLLDADGRTGRRALIVHRRARARRRLRAERSRRRCARTRSTSSRDFEGHTDRDVDATTILARHDGHAARRSRRRPASSAGRPTT